MLRFSPSDSFSSSLEGVWPPRRRKRGCVVGGHVTVQWVELAFAVSMRLTLELMRKLVQISSCTVADRQP